MQVPPSIITYAVAADFAADAGDPADVAPTANARSNADKNKTANAHDGPPPAVDGNTKKGTRAVTMSQQTVIFSDAKSSVCVFFWENTGL